MSKYLSKGAGHDYGLRGQKPVDQGPGGATRWLNLGVFLAILAVVSTSLSTGLAKHITGTELQPLIYHWYAPWDWIVWAVRWDLWGNGTLLSLIYNHMGIFVLLAGLYGIFALMYVDRRTGAVHDMHGTARFATMRDVKEGGLLGNRGVVLGGFRHGKEKHVLRNDGPEHVLLIAPTGSGKGVSVIVPTLLTWEGSVVVYDLKKENWALTASWRKNYADNVVLRFEPACDDGSAARFNPLEQIRLFTDHDVQDAQNIAAIIMEYGVDDGRSKTKDDYWTNAGYGLLVAYILHVCYVAAKQNKVASLPMVSDALCDPEQNWENLFEVMINEEHRDGKPHPEVVRQASSKKNLIDQDAGKQLAGIQGTIESKLQLYGDPIVRRNIEKSDFKLQDLMHLKKPVSLYICVGSTDKVRMKPLVKLILTQMIREQTKEVKYDRGELAAEYKHKLLLLIDEFPSLGRMPIMNEAIAFLRGYGIRCMLVIQDWSQMRSPEAYGEKEAITANCGIRVAFAPNTISTAKELSEMCGQTTVIKEDINISKFTNNTRKGQVQVTAREISRPLLTADEVMRIRPIQKTNAGMAPGETLVFIGGRHVILGEQLMHFADPVLRERAMLGAPDESDVLVE